MIEGENKFDLNNFLNKEDLNFIADENDPSWIEAHTEEHKIDLEQDQDDLPKINTTLRLGGKARQDRYYLTATIYRDKDIVMQDVQIRRESSGFVLNSRSELNTQEVPDNIRDATQLIYDLYVHQPSLWYTIAAYSDDAVGDLG